MKKYSLIIAFICVALIYGCVESPTQKQSPTNAEPKPRVKIPAFNKDSAYVFIEKQLSFGTRVPGTEGHTACKDWMVQKFKSYGADVIEQDFMANIYTGDSWPSTNIIAQFNPQHKERIILSAHWDSRFIGEEDSNPKMKDKPIPGADDGGSGTGVLIEIARILQANPIDLGVDIILWDAEDQGPRDGGSAASNKLWCLGSQHWSNNKHKKDYRAQWGINLDMIGAKNPTFCKDEASVAYASDLLNKVWSLAQNMGYSDMFVDQNVSGIIDDHLFINQMAKIPMIDIINYKIENGKGSFMDKWHTHDDDITNINKRSLRVVGQVVTAVIYKESDGSL